MAAAPSSGTGATPAAGGGNAPQVKPAAGSGAVAGGGTAGTPAVTAGTGGTMGQPPTTDAGNTWPQMGYDQNNTYFNPKETKLSVQNAPMLKEKWRFMVAGYPPGTPTIAEGKVYVMATGGTYAINLADGTKAWERLDLMGTATVTYDAGFVYVHTFEGPNLYKLKASDGTTVWGPVQSNPNNMCDGMSSPIVGGGAVIVGHSCGTIEVGGDVTSARGGVEAFDLATGMRKWQYWTVPETGENGAMVWSSVTIDVEGKVVFAATGNNYSVQGENSDAIHAIDLNSGMKKWKQQVHTNDTWSLLFAPTGPDTDFGANPILGVVGGKKIVANGDKGSSFFMFDRETGAVLWKRDQLSSSRNAQNGGILMNGAFDGKYFYVVSNQPPNAAVLHALDPMKEGADAWPAKTYMKTTWGAPSVANGVLAVPNDDDLYILNAMTGEQLAKFTTGGTIAAGAPSIVDGNIVVGSGLSYYLDPSTKNNNQIICYAVP
ncbi:MAG TPA: PQQ-binding-like beta-propeller repeat protein [Polyangiales bacterium]|nr:PQQ-binding-like beta-propeller repeat protein [Polyangiales bacterium]